MNSSVLRLRCQSKAGQHYLTQLSSNSSVGRLKEVISEVTKIPMACIRIRQGYPPKDIDLTDNTQTMSHLPFRSGDTLYVDEDPSLRQRQKECLDTDLQVQIQELYVRGVLMRKTVPANNSCLFTSINAVMTKGDVDLSSAQQMRQLIAGIVLSDPEQFNSAFLEKSNSDYCAWIMKENSWGGGIEISILSKYYEVEIDIVDTQSGRIDRFGEDMNYNKRVLLIYDGVHYDPLIMEPLIPGEPVQTIFSTKDENILAQAMEIASEAKATRQYTDTANFSLRCNICQIFLKGHIQAQSHAKKTGHTDFGEV
ncbi:hypothetical protein ACJMK2_041137 [Sinanodonta woodiana]|uniref:Ubiquitin thioesterase OTU n=1 Tax=Sinanodonta woodiana TaxID=1069815 RepID=A0ABD3W443_SINWO